MKQHIKLGEELTDKLKTMYLFYNVTMSGIAKKALKAAKKQNLYMDDLYTPKASGGSVIEVYSELTREEVRAVINWYCEENKPNDELFNKMIKEEQERLHREVDSMVEMERKKEIIYVD